MIEEVFEDFLLKQKKLWLERKANGKEPNADLLNESEIRYEKNAWIMKAIKQARYAITTHAGTFTHPDAKTSCFIFSKSSVNNGLLITNNVRCKNSFDLFGNAATDTFVKEIYLFLQESVEDKNVWYHFKNESDIAKNFVARLNVDFEEAKKSFSKLIIDSEISKTHQLLKQVYFSIGENEYHLLSLLTPSIVTTELLNRINFIRFNDAAKEARALKRDNKFCVNDFSEIYNLTEIKFGGSKPQNVSVLNSQNAGRAYLLSSCPPVLEKRAIRLPKTDFFAQCLYRKNYQESFIQLHKFMQLDLNNDDIRTAIRNIIQFVIDQILVLASKTREYSVEGWSNQDYYASLPKLQRIWLDKIYQTERDEDDDWRDELSREIARWILRSYEKVISDAYKLGTGEILDVKQRVEKSLQQAKEFF